MNKFFLIPIVLVSCKSFASENQLLQRYQGIKSRYLEISSKIQSLKEDFNEHKDFLSDENKDELDFNLIKIDGTQGIILRQTTMLDDCFSSEQQLQVLEGMKGCIISCDLNIRKLENMFRTVQDDFEKTKEKHNV